MMTTDDRIAELKTFGYSPDDTGEPNPDVQWLVAELEKARAVLKKVEWAGMEEPDDPVCPSCGARAYQGDLVKQGPHKPRCELEEVIR